MTLPEIRGFVEKNGKSKSYERILNDYGISEGKGG